MKYEVNGARFATYNEACIAATTLETYEIHFLYEPTVKEWLAADRKTR